MKTRDLILQKTFGLLLAKGYDGVSVSDIQQNTGMARGLLYHYFGGQEALFNEAVEKYLDAWFQVDKQEVQHKTVGELIVFTLEKYNRVGQEIADCFGQHIVLADIEMLFFEAMRHNREFTDHYKMIRESRTAAWKTALLNSFSAGELRSGLNLASVARQLNHIVDGVSIDRSSGANMPEVVYGIEKELKGFFELICR